MKLRKIPKAAKRTFTGLMAVVLAATAMGPLSVLVSANSKSFQYIEELKQDKTDQGTGFNIFEIVPDASETTMGYYVGGNDPISYYISAAVEQGYDSANRQTAINNIYNSKLTDIIGTTDAYPMTKSSTGYVEYVPWADDVPEDLVNNQAMLTSKEEEKYTDVPDKFVADSENDGEYQSHGVYVLPTEYFDLNSWATNPYTTSEASSNLSIETDKKSYIKLTNTDNSTITSDYHTGYALTAIGYDNYYGITVTPGETYCFSFDFDTDYSTTKTNGVDGQVTLYAYGKTKTPKIGSTSYTLNYTKDENAKDGKQAQSTGTTKASSTYILSAQGVTTGLYDEYTGHYAYTFTVPDDVYYLQVSFGTWHQGYGNTGSVTFSNIHLRNVNEVPDMVQEISTFEPATKVEENTADDYYYAVNFTPITSVDEFTSDAVIYEQVWSSDNKPLYYVLNEDGTIESELVTEDTETEGTKVPAYQLLFSTDDVSGDAEYSDTKLKAGGYGKLSINESADTVVKESPDAEHFYHAVPVYNNAGDLSFIKVEDDTSGYYSGTNSYFITQSINYSYVGSGGNYNYDNTKKATSTVTVYTQNFYYDKGLTSNEWFKYKVLDRYDEDSYNFFITSSAYSPKNISDNEEQFLSLVKSRDLIVLSAGTQVNYTSFSSDISSEMREAILECVGSDYNIPIAVDLQILNMVDADSQLAKLVNALVDRSTDEGVSTKEGGVAQNVYIFNSAHVGSSSMATTKFNTAVNQTVSSISSPYYDVYAEIYEENVYRKLDTYTYSSDELPSSFISEATCLRCIINYAGRRVKNTKDKVKVLDIEPYISVDHRTAVITDEVYAYASKKYSKTDCLKALDVISWLPSGTFTDSSGNPITENSTEEEAAKYVDITTMSVAEFVGHNEDLIGNYDLVYFGDSLENFNQANSLNGTKQTHYNDTDMDGLIYSGMGDTYVIGNNANVINGDTLLGLNTEDYTKSVTLFGKTIRYMVSGETSTVRTTGNDITDTVKEKLEAFTNAGLPVVIANSLTTSAEGTGVDGGTYVYDENGDLKLQVKYTVSLDTKTVYRRDKDSKHQYYTFFLAKLNGDLPTGVKVNFSWYYASSVNENGEPQGTKNIGDVQATNLFGVSKGTSEEPMHSVDVQVEKNVHNWYSTIGDIDQSFDYYDWNDDDTKDAITGMTIPDSSGKDYQKTVGGYYFCVATLEVDDDYKSDPILSSYNNSSWRSDIYQSKTEDKTLTVTVSGSNEAGNSTVTISPNPYYTDGIGDNFSFWWKSKKWEGSDYWFLGKQCSHKWEEDGDDGDDKVHRIDHEALWQAHQEVTTKTEVDGVTQFSKTDANINYTNGSGVKITSTRSGNTVTLEGYDVDDGNKLVQKYISTGSRDKDENGNQTNPGSLTMISYCAHSTNANRASYVECRIKGLKDDKNMINVTTPVEGQNPTGYSVNLDNDGSTQLTSEQNYGSYAQKQNSGHERGLKSTGASGNGTFYWNYNVLTLSKYNYDDSKINQPILVSAELSSISTISVDNTTKLYQYLSSVYDTVTTKDGGNVKRGDGAELKRKDNVFNENQFKYAKDTSEIKQNLFDYLCKVYNPELRMINNSVVSYPQVLSGTEISGEFAIYTDMDTNGTYSYRAELYIDQDHDAKFTDTEKIGFTKLIETGSGNTVSKDNLKSTTSDLSQWHEYKFTKQLSDSYMGLVSWKLEIVRTDNSSVYDSYTGYSYIQTSEKKTINAVQVLPADWWTSGSSGDTDGYVSTFGQWKRNTNSGYKDSEYTGSLAVGETGTSSELKTAYENERANEITGNAYIGSVFLGDDGDTKIVEKTDDGQYKVVYADAFYSLVNASDSILDRTVYYESTGAGENDYRTHVVFWVRPQGEKTARKDENGQIEVDKKGNTIYEYEKCDFEVDIALTDIYELNNLYKSSECKFLDSYDMLILGFGDSYGKCETQTSWLEFFNYKSKTKATLGFSIGAALAVKKFIEDDKPVLFCHDTTNTTNNYITYFAQNALSTITEELNKLANKVETLWNKIKEWFTGKDFPDEDNFTVDIQSSKIKDGYYNNILLRDSLNLDRFGITYSIRQTIGEDNISENMDNNTWADGYKYNGIPYYQRESTSVDAMRAKNFSIIYKSKSAVTSTGENGVKYVEYNSNKEPKVDMDRVKSDDIGEKSTVDIDKSAQGFTTWSIVRYGDEGTKNQLLPAGIVESNTDGHTILTNKVQQVNKGQITTYPYDINTAEFGGTTGNTDEYSNSYGKITIKATHEQVYQVNTNGDDTTVWYTLAGADEEADDSDYRDDYDAISKDVVNSYYIFTSGNVTYTGAGHSNIFSEEEAKLFLNTLVASYRLPGEKPDLDFVNDKGEQSSYILLTAEETEKTDDDGNVTKEFTVDDGIAAIRIDDPNYKKEKLTVNFFTKDDSGEYKTYDGIELYESKDCSGTPVANDSVKSGVVYYFKVPEDIKKALANNTAGDESGTESSGSYTLYAQAVSTVKTSGESKDYASGYKYIHFRRVGLYDLA